MGQTHDKLAELEAENRALRSRLNDLEARGSDADSTVESIFAAAPTGIGLVVDRVFLRVNARLCEMLGYASGELIGKSARMVYESDVEYDRVGQVKYDQIGVRGTGTVETRWVRKDGRVIDVLLSSAPLDRADLSRGVTFTALDISASRQAEEQLRRTEMLVATITQAVQDSIFVKDVDRRYTFVNRAMERTLGLPASKILGKTPEEIFDPAAAATIAEVDRPVLEGHVVDEVKELDVGDEPISFHTVQVPLHAEDGSVSGICGIVRDVTQQKRAERERLEFMERVQQTQKLESLGVLAGGIAHDFNNLLVGILGNAGLALLDLGPGAPARQYLADIERAAQRASELVRQMLAYAGKGRMITERVDLQSLVEEMAHLIKTSISKRARLQFSHTGGAPAIDADATEIRQVAMNLITNASDALGDGDGTIVVTTGTAECDPACLAGTLLADGLEPGTYATLEVSDTGCGMDPETLDKIFDPFFSTKFTGRGLGLAAVLGIVRSHRGALSVESTPGRGSTFRVLFPLSQAKAGAVTAEPHAKPDWRGSGTILLADDERTVLKVAARMLARLGFEVVEAADGQEALELFRRTPDRFAAVLLDLTMPRMGGDECFTALRDIRPDVRVVLSSGYSEHELTRRFEGRGLAGFAQKPYRLKDLARVLRQAIAPEAAD